MNMFILMDGSGLQRDDGMNEEVKAKVEKAKREIRRRLMDTDKVTFGGILKYKDMQFMRQGGDVELQMVALLIAQHRLVDAINKDWSTNNLSREDCTFRFVAINTFADEWVKAEQEK